MPGDTCDAGLQDRKRGHSQQCGLRQPVWYAELAIRHMRLSPMLRFKPAIARPLGDPQQLSHCPGRH
jgi:hypothetical protein